ncbi:unnamed protein product, partial [Cyprideis torosa]
KKVLAEVEKRYKALKAEFPEEKWHKTDTCRRLQTWTGCGKNSGGFRGLRFGATLLFLFLVFGGPNLYPVILNTASRIFRGTSLRSDQKCWESSSWKKELFRKPMDCELCKEIRSAIIINETNRKEFEKQFGPSRYMGPVVVTDAMQNWTAKNAFSYEYFKELFHQPGVIDEFFKYRSSFLSPIKDIRNIEVAFNLDPDRVALKPGYEPWYFGWGIQLPRLSSVLKEHYDQPYFLPENCERTVHDWVFIGSPGRGLYSHIDFVANPSWQAQVKGQKRWYIKPPPECYFQCAAFDFLVKKGEIVVLDTNRWYHQTSVENKEVSITIGNEFVF